MTGKAYHQTWFQGEAQPKRTGFRVEIPACMSQITNQCRRIPETHLWVRRLDPKRGEIMHFLFCKNCFQSKVGSLSKIAVYCDLYLIPCLASWPKTVYIPRKSLCQIDNSTRIQKQVFFTFQGLTFDVKEDRMYWTDFHRSIIRRSFLNGTGLETLVVYRNGE